MSVTPPPSPAEAFAGIIATLLAMVGARVARPGKPGLAGPLTLAIAIRLQRMRSRIARFAARWQAGTLAPPRPRPARPRRERTAPGQWDHLPKLPRGRLWLVRLVPGIGVGANYLRILLDEPDMVAMLQAAPQIGRTLRPFWHMLSKEPLPPILQRQEPSAPSPGASRPVDPLRGSTPQAGEGKQEAEGKIARQRPLSRLQDRAAKQTDGGVRVLPPPQSNPTPPRAPEVAPPGKILPAPA